MTSPSWKDRLEQLSPEKRALLTARVRRASSADATDSHSAPSGDGTLVAYVELDSSSPSSETAESDLRSALQAKLPDYMVPPTICLLGSLPRTSAGKIDRPGLPWPVRASGTGKAATASPPDGQGDARNSADDSSASGLRLPANEAETTLARIWAEVLDLDEVGVDENFFELGGDSILSIRIIARANQAGIKITPKQFFDAPTIAELAALAAPADRAADESAGSDPSSVSEGEPFGLLPIQHWFFEQATADPHHWNQSAEFQLGPEIEEQHVLRAINTLWETHDALRLLFTHEGPEGPIAGSSAGWSQRIAPVDSVDRSGSTTESGSTWIFKTIDTAGLSPEEETALILEEEEREHRRFDLAHGPLFRAIFFDRSRSQPHDKRGRLLLLAHHLVVDGVSWHLLTEDLDALLDQAHRGEALQLPPKTASLPAWFRELKRFAQTPELEEDARFWLRDHEAHGNLLPLDFARGEDSNRRGDVRIHQETLDAERTEQLLREVPEAYRTQMGDALLTALLRALTKWTGASEWLLDLEGHGREAEAVAAAEANPLDLSRTVGWLTSVFPVPLKTGAQDDLGEALKGTKEQLRSVPRAGLSHGVLRHLTPDDSIREALSAQRRPEIVFNYLGQSSSGSASAILQQVRGAGASARSGSSERPYVFEIDAAVVEGVLRIDWAYSPKLHRPETIAHLAESFLDELQALIEHCLSGAAGVTPSDFPLANLEQGDLDKLADLLGGLDESEKDG